MLRKPKDLTLKNTWEEIADMKEERGDAFGVAMKERIFVAGGEIGRASCRERV